MSPDRFDALLQRVSTNRVGIVGDFSLDRYFDIDPAQTEISIETELPVYNVSQVRCQAGAAGNITANLAAYGAAQLFPIGYRGDDSEGFELQRALTRLSGVDLTHFQQTDERQTFSYSKPLLHHPGQPPEELSRLDIKNRTPTPKTVEEKLIASLRTLAPHIDVLVVMDQAGVPQMGAITQNVLSAIEAIHREHPSLTIIADSRHGLTDFPSFIYKMNAAEFATLTQSECHLLSDIQAGAVHLAARNQHPVFITMAEQGMIGATPTGESTHVPARPLRGPIDIVGAGDTVTATLALALAADATPFESMELAQAAASLVVHQLGTTGTPNPRELRQLLST